MTHRAPLGAAPGNELNLHGAELTDPDILVNAHPDQVSRMLGSVSSPQARQAAAIYQASAHLHRDTDPVIRRQMLALDAARHGAPELSDCLISSPVEGEPDAEWRVEWATGPSRLGHTARPEDVEFAVATATIDGRLHTVVGGPDELVRIWDLATGEPVGEPLTGHEATVLAVATTVVDGCPHAVTGDMDGAVRVWDLTTGEPVGEPLIGHDDEVNCVATALIDGRPHVVTVGEDETTWMWDLATGEPVGEPLIDHEAGVLAMATATIDGHPHMVTGTFGGGVVVWDLRTGETARELNTGAGTNVMAVATTAIDGQPHAITTSYRDVVDPGDDDRLSLWDLTTGRQVADLEGDTDKVQAMATALIDGRPHAVTGGQRGRRHPELRGTVRVRDVATFRQAGRELLFPMPVHTVTVAANGWLIVGFGNEAAAFSRR